MNGTPTRVAFVCEGNAGRSQFAAVLAEQEGTQRGLDVEVVTGGLVPADHVHPEVVEALAEVDVDIADRTPRQIRPEDVADAAYVVTMGCSVDDFAPPDWAGVAERWELDHPSAGDIAAAREQRDEIRTRVRELFDRIEADAA